MLSGDFLDGLFCEGAGMCRPLHVTACLDLQWQSNYFSPFSDKQPLGGVCAYVHSVPYKHVYVTGFGGLLTIIGNGDKGPVVMSMVRLLGQIQVAAESLHRKTRGNRSDVTGKRAQLC